MKKWIKRVLWFLVGLVLIFTSVVYFYLPRLVIEIKNPIVFKHRDIPVTYGEVFPDGKEVTITTFDNLKLKGFLTYATTQKAKGTVILLHGIRSVKESYIGLSKDLSVQGYNTFAFDLRAHGESEGRYNTFGAKERKDVSAIVDYLDGKGYSNVGVWGRSLGGAIALQALGTDDRLKFGVIESTFSDFNIVVHDYTALFTGIDSYAFSNFLVKRAGEIGEFNPESVKPVELCKQIKQPIYMSHGTADHRIAYKYGKMNYDALASEQKVFETIPNATHMNVWYIAGEAHFNKIVNFLNETIAE
ncbi:alpha/beta hydrolase [Neptunitalea lumnitzerae]|uniref:Esterase n=1 Tax=Neptunitalea lumnitzerae TaxID=2965509 RepID=A0ABQ5MLD2_9FLAO|nr:alpha/beta hydrolase [Neptunitalea sp. Y10]GLB50194.1 esterase [Neptunitalea sp. Y10]